MPFAGLSTDYDFFLERVPMREAVAVLERWKELQEAGWDVTALGAVDETHLIGLGFRYLEAAA